MIAPCDFDPFGDFDLLFGAARLNMRIVDLAVATTSAATGRRTSRASAAAGSFNIHFDGPTRRWLRFNRRHGGRFVFHYTLLGFIAYWDRERAHPFRRSFRGYPLQSEDKLARRA